MELAKVIAENRTDKRKTLEEHESRVQSDLDVWTKEVLPKWRETGSFNPCPEHKRLRRLFNRGVPPAVRGEVWSKLIGNTLQIDLRYYRVLRGKAKQGRFRLGSFFQSAMSPEFLSQSRGRGVGTVHSRSITRRHSHSSVLNLSTQPKNSLDETHQMAFSFLPVQSHSPLPGKEQVSIKELENDIPRTFSELKMFGPDGPYHESLRELLELYVYFRPEIGYVQGMSYLAAMLLLNMSPYEAFVALANLMNKPFLFHLYRLKWEKVQNYLHSFNYFFKSNLKGLHKHFKQQGVTADYFYISWSLTLFCRILPLDIASRVWDNFFLEGELFCIKTALGILKYHQDKLLKWKFEEILCFFKTSMKDISGELLFSHISAMRVKEDELVQLHEVHDKHELAPLLEPEEPNGINCTIA